VALFYFEGLSGREAAEVLETSAAALEVLLVRARRALRKRLEGAGVRVGVRL
jgi:DNA-directed RNA polymerase specialized sigma24 family protein